MTGGTFAPIPVIAFAGADQEVLVDSKVALDGSRSSGPITSYNWTQTAGPAVTPTGGDTAHPTFTAPSAAALAPGTDATLTFQLTVTGAGGPQTNTVNVHVVASAPAPDGQRGRRPDGGRGQRSRSTPRSTPDKLATSRVQYVQSKRDWRIDGTSSLAVRASRSPCTTGTPPTARWSGARTSTRSAPGR